MFYKGDYIMELLCLAVAVLLYGTFDWMERKDKERQVEF